MIGIPKYLSYDELMNESGRIIRENRCLPTLTYDSCSYMTIREPIEIEYLCDYLWYSEDDLIKIYHMYDKVQYWHPYFWNYEMTIEETQMHMDLLGIEKVIVGREPIVQNFYI